MNAWSLQQRDKAGVTKLIRQRLNFNDELQWKRFSARRLELIDTYQLSFRKASEQDAMIRQCAQTLAGEFGYPAESLPDFDKLVRCAIQSARRNRKRAKKNKSTFVAVDVTESLLDLSEEPKETRVFPETDSKLAISSLVKPVLSVTRSTDEYLSHITSSNFTSSDETKALNKLLSCFKRSKTCFQFTTAEEGVLSDVLESLGNSAVAAAVILTMETHFEDIQQSSASYIRLKLGSDSGLCQILKNLSDAQFEVERLGEYAGAELFKRLIGGSIKDFGFDYVLTPLCEVFRCTILREYPLAIRTKQQSQTSPVSPSSSVSSVAPKTVELRFLNKSLKFSFDSESNAPPTLLELLENAKSAFSIISPKILKLKHKGSFLGSDYDIEKLFTAQGDIVIEICQI